ncbi:MAG: hypothetical protein PVF45_02750 [Anaerolineae bacterium]
MSGKFTWDYDAPLARAPGETRKANDALRDYWLMGSGRSLRKLHQTYTKHAPGEPPTRHLRTLKGWSAKYQWQARIDRAKELDDAANQAQWAQRRREVRESDWKDGDKLRDKAGELLDELSRFKRTTESEGTDPKTGEKVRIITVGLSANLNQIAGALKAASGLQRRAAEVLPPTQRHEITGRDGGPVTHKRETDWSGLDDDDLDQLILNLQTALDLGAAGETPAPADERPDGAEPDGPAHLDDAAPPPTGAG